jgi:hypothetical protein
MSEVNERWQRDHRSMRRCSQYLAVLAAVTWPISYAASFPIYTAPQWEWWGIVSYGFLAGASICTAGAAITFGLYLTDSAPLPGANR